MQPTCYCGLRLWVEDAQQGVTGAFLHIHLASWSEIQDFSPTAQRDEQIQKVSFGCAAVWVQ